jgi:hypothetical protein
MSNATTRAGTALQLSEAAATKGSPERESLKSLVRFLSEADRHEVRPWSETVLAEAFYHLRHNHQAAPEQQIERWRDQLGKCFPDWEPQTVPCPKDTNDRHVLAARPRA